LKGIRLIRKIQFNNRT